VRRQSSLGRGDTDAPSATHAGVVMEKMLVVLASTVGSSVGWWLGARLGLMTAFVLSIVGLGVGVWAGRQFAHRWMP